MRPVQQGGPCVSVIIPAYNAARTLPQQLAALSQQVDPPRFEVVVADNGSTDATARVAATFDDGLDIRVVSATAATGPSHARNVGARAARADLLAFCDADDIVHEGWVAGIADALARFDLVAGRIDLETLNTGARREASGDMPEDRMPVTLGLPYAVGCNAGCRRAVFHEVGGFDETFRGHEEADFSWRVQFAGYSLGFSEQATVSYRLASQARKAFVHHRISGSSYVQLYAKHRARLSSVPTSTLERELRGMLRTFRRCPEVLDTRTRASWIGRLGWQVGRLQGWMATGVTPPI